MDHRLSVLVQVDLHGRSVRLVVTGCVTEVNHHVLSPLIRRARLLIPAATVEVELTAAGHVEALAVELLHRAVELLHRAVDHDPSLEKPSPVRVLLPAELPNHPPARAPHPQETPRCLPA